MSETTNIGTSAIERVAAEIRGRDRFLLTAHEGPDGDALGSLLGMHRLLTQLGKDSVMFLAAKEFPLPIEYRFLPLEEVFHEPPADMADRAIVFLDCGNIDRMPVDFLSEDGHFTINIDHHHDNTLFGDVNLVEIDASCTAEIVYELAILLGAEITPDIAAALYVGLVTDTGRFQYRTTSPAALRLAARLVEAGADVHKVFELVFETLPLGKMQLLGRVLEHMQSYEGGRLLVSYVTRDDLALVEGDEATTEGLIDNLRAVDGVQVAALIREQVPHPDGTITPNRVSLRSRGSIDVSQIARKSQGGGHKQAAGFSHPGSIEEIREFIVDEVVSQLAESAA